SVSASSGAVKVPGSTRSVSPLSSIRRVACSYFVTRIGEVNSLSNASANPWKRVAVSIWRVRIHMSYLNGCRGTEKPATAPSYSGLVRRPLTAVTRVRIPLGSQQHIESPRFAEGFRVLRPDHAG